MLEDFVPMSRPPALKLPPVLDTAAAGELKRELLEALGSGGCINVDASAVQRITTPCLQIMAAAAKSAAQSGGGRLRLHSVPQIVSETIGMLGLAETLGTGEVG
jgi:anti-anti-sigma regulatory factor